MNTATARMKDCHKSFFVWIHNHKYEPWLILSLITVITIFLDFMLPQIKIQPTPLNPQITNEIFMPTGAEQVLSVKNILEGTISKGIALMQIERTMESYKSLAAETSQYWAVIKRDTDSNKNPLSKIILDYYTKNPSDTQVFHSADVINPPKTNLLFHSYSLNNFKREANQITANYNSNLNYAAIILCIFAISIFSLLIAILPSMILRKLSKRIIRKML